MKKQTLVKPKKDIISKGFWGEICQQFFITSKSIVELCDGDLIAGILLSKIAHWYVESEKGSTKLRVRKDSKHWLVKRRQDWYEECCLTPKYYDRAIKKLVEKGFVEVETRRFNGAPTTHIWLNVKKLTIEHQKVSEKRYSK